MRKTLRHILTVICLAAVMFGSSASACACDLMPPKNACETHDHSHTHDDDGDKKPGDCDSNCPCATCHSCPHVMVVLPAIVPTCSCDAASPDFIQHEAAIGPIARAIFIPPKLG